MYTVLGLDDGDPVWSKIRKQITMNIFIGEKYYYNGIDCHKSLCPCPEYSSNTPQCTH